MQDFRRVEGRMTPEEIAGQGTTFPSVWLDARTMEHPTCSCITQNPHLNIQLNKGKPAFQQKRPVDFSIKETHNGYFFVFFGNNIERMVLFYLRKTDSP